MRNNPYSHALIPNFSKIVNEAPNFYFHRVVHCIYVFLLFASPHALSLLHITFICIVQAIGVVVADTHENARNAAGKVHVKYEDLPAILSITDAIKYQSFHPDTDRTLTKGDVELCFQSGKCDRIIEGQVQVGGQEHFYLEPNSSLVWTIDGGNEVHMISSTQVCFICFNFIYLNSQVIF